MSRSVCGMRPSPSLLYENESISYHVNQLSIDHFTTLLTSTPQNFKEIDNPLWPIVSGGAEIEKKERRNV